MRCAAKKSESPPTSIHMRFLPNTGPRARPHVTSHQRAGACGLFGGLRFGLRCLDDAGSKIRRGDDLQHLEVVRAGDLAMLDAGCLQDAIARADRALALALVLEGRP